MSEETTSMLLVFALKLTHLPWFWRVRVFPPQTLMFGLSVVAADTTWVTGSDVTVAIKHDVVLILSDYHSIYKKTAWSCCVESKKSTCPCISVVFFGHDGRLPACVQPSCPSFYLTHYTGDVSCVSPLQSLHIISCPSHFHLCGWVGGLGKDTHDKSNQKKFLTRGINFHRGTNGIWLWFIPLPASCVAAVPHAALSAAVGQSSTQRSSNI